MIRHTTSPSTSAPSPDNHPLTPGLQVRRLTVIETGFALDGVDGRVSTAEELNSVSCSLWKDDGVIQDILTCLCCIWTWLGALDTLEIGFVPSVQLVSNSEIDEVKFARLTT